MSSASPTKFDLEILYQDELFIVINKRPTFHTDELEIRCGELYPQIRALHRLDRDTSGALMLGFPQKAPELLELFKKPGSVEKIYWAGASQTFDWIDAEQPVYKFEGFIGSRYRSSKKSHISFEKSFRGFHSQRPISHIVRKFPENDLAEFHTVFSGIPYQVELITGARHQIRAYFDFIECPLVGDSIYNPQPKSQRLELHCRSLAWTHPTTHTLLKVIAPLK